jgi:flagellar biosynthesis protein FliR
MPELSNMALAAFLVFCRIGACIMLVPGYSSANIPAQVRLFVALSLSLGLAPLLMPAILPLVANAPLLSIAALIVSELLIGAVIGLMGRMFFLGLQTLATAMAMSIGLSSTLATPIDEVDPVPALTSLIMVSVGALFFVTDQHWEVIRGLTTSYRIWQPSDGLSADAALGHLSESLTESFVLALRVSSPFIVYGVVVNLAIGLINKLTPAIPIYFISVPFVLFGGLALAYLTGPELLLQFMIAFSAWMVR